MLYFIVIIMFVIFFIAFYFVILLFKKDKDTIGNRINQLKNITGNENSVNNDNTEDASFSERAIKPFYEYLCNVFLKVTPKNKLKMINKKLDRAGLLKKSSVYSYIFIRNMIIIICSILNSSFIYLLTDNFLYIILFFVLTLLLAYVISDIYLNGKIKKRKRLILHDLPFTLDLITVSVEAGLSFDGAMIRVVNNLNGDLCDEFAKSLKEIKMGIQRKTALRNMSDRCDVKELSMLITSLIQADEMGVSLGRVLRIEAGNLRSHIKQAAREKAMKAPVKMLFPLIFFIFPSIFIIILGPAVIKIINIFR